MVRRIRQIANKGFTAVELIIALALLGIILTLGYNLFYQVDKSFREGEKQWIAQKEAQKIADWLDNSMKNAYTVLIYSNSAYYADTSFSEDDEYVYIYETDDHRIYFRNSGEEQAQLLADIPAALEFRIETADPSTPKKQLEYDVTILDDDGSTSLYNMSSNIHFANMLRSAGVNLLGDGKADGTTTRGNMIKMLNNTGDLNSIVVNTSSFCFIATAAYGAPDSTPVSILRQFRDKCLLTNKAGQAFVEFYYTHSPAIASFIQDKPVLRVAVCILLMPLVLAAYLLIVPGAVWLMLYGVAIAFILYLYKRYMVGKGLSPLVQHRLPQDTGRS